MNNMKTNHLGFLLFCLCFGLAITTVSADDFNLQDGKTKIIEILTYLYGKVLKESVPDFQSITDAPDFDGMSNAAEAFLSAEKVKEIKKVARNFVPRISGILSKYLLKFREEMNAHQDTANKTTPMSSQLESIRQWCEESTREFYLK